LERDRIRRLEATFFLDFILGLRLTDFNLGFAFFAFFDEVFFILFFLSAAIFAINFLIN
jgi:hypothetical protein